MTIRLAAYNSSERDKRSADSLCDGDDATGAIQAAADEATSKGARSHPAEPVELAAGWYRVRDQLELAVPLVGRGLASLVWAGPPAEKWLIRTSASVCGVYFQCRQKVGAIDASGTHQGRFEDLHVFEHAGGGFKLAEGWFNLLANVRVNGGRGTAFELTNFNGSIAERISSTGVTGAPRGVVYCQGQGDLRQVCIERTEGPAVVLDDFRHGRLSGLWLEHVGADRMVEVRNTSNAELERILSWQYPEEAAARPDGVIVAVSQCRNVEVRRVGAKNVRGAIVAIDAESLLGGCRASDVLDLYGRQLSAQSSGVQPRHIIRSAGFDHPADSRTAKITRDTH